MKPFDYWEECIASAADECGLKITTEQLKYMAEAVEGGHENYGMAFYQPESPYPREIAKLEGELKKEKSKVVCNECRGSGEEIIHGPHHSSISRCWKCHGEGKRLP